MTKTPQSVCNKHKPTNYRTTPINMGGKNDPADIMNNRPIQIDMRLLAEIQTIQVPEA